MRPCTYKPWQPSGFSKLWEPAWFKAWLVNQQRFNSSLWPWTCQSTVYSTAAQETNISNSSTCTQKVKTNFKMCPIAMSTNTHHTFLNPICCRPLGGYIQPGIYFNQKPPCSIGIYRNRFVCVLLSSCKVFQMRSKIQNKLKVVYSLQIKT